MKILHITNTFYEGGVDTFLFALLPALQQAGHQVELLVLDKSRAQHASEMAKTGVKVHIGKYANVRDLRNIGLIRSLICTGKYDIVHSHLFPTQYFTAIAKMTAHTGAKFVTTEHTTYNKRRDRSLFRPIEQWIYGKYDAIVGCSSDATKNLGKWLNFKKKSKCGQINTVKNGIDLSAFRTASKYSKQELALPDDARIVFMAARFFNQKNHKCVIRAAKLLPPDVHVLFCGSGDEGIAECRQLAETLDVGERVHFLGRRNDVPRLIKSSDIGVLSSFYEGFGLAILETMAGGLPSIASDVDGTREIVKDYGALFPIDDYQCLAQEITRLLNDKNYYDAMAQRCYARAQDFSKEKMVEQYLNLYNELCNRN